MGDAPEDKIVAFNKMCHKTKIQKFMKFVSNFNKLVLESLESILGGYPKRQCLDLDER